MFEPDRWVEHLDAHRISYVLVGGYGATFHGAQRPTYDIDVVPAWDLENLARLCDALRAVDGVLHNRATRRRRRSHARSAHRT
ncbi:hypothetical protein BN381_20019 [Candidatus Microthrix parvicella RN1]|jgi:hypothetical protein|uniref:Uncharacterized protein n=1 Tax=Candidatus Neomicrothrix parvicella RN1 TaxID=1229780 RepID=R4YY13_9ACTN|nr:hypothetical protein BN381_20019 [Candidatus Microthrix parvicella RN1]